MSDDSERPAPFVVIDASVALKWVLDDEDHVAEAVALRDTWLGGTLDAVAPSLWRYEVLNGLVIAVRKERLAQEKGLEAVGYLDALGLRFADPGPEATYHQATRLRITAYDASYIALAEELRVEMWTGDRRLHRAVAGKTERVHWIGEWGAETVRRSKTSSTVATP